MPGKGEKIGVDPMIHRSISIQMPHVVIELVSKHIYTITLCVCVCVCVFVCVFIYTRLLSPVL